MRRNGFQIFFLLAAGFLVQVLTCVDAIAGPKPDTVKLVTHQIQLRALPVPFKRGDADKKVFGKLIWSGGFQIMSPSPYLGVYSGAAISKDGGKLILVSDAGTWALMALSYQKNRLAPPRSALVGPLLAKSGKPLFRGRDRDAEAITLLRADKFFGKAYVSFEQFHRIGVFSLSKKGLSHPKKYLRLPEITKRLRGNAGLESLAILRGGRLKGSLVAIAQSKQDKAGNFKGWLVRKGKVKPIKFTPPELDTYRITDAVSLPNGDLILLERRFKFLTVNIRVRYVRQAALLSNRPIEGTVLMEANSNTHMVDNMEVITAHKNRQGETIITLLSDDNFNSFQKTLILQFALPKTSLVAARLKN